VPGKGCAMPTLFPLHKAERDRPVQVVSVGCETSMRSRLSDLGLMEGCRVEYLYASAFGDPRAYRVKGTVLGIRNCDAQHILCREEGQP
jgi:ferrous iron transport protein A